MGLTKSKFANTFNLVSALWPRTIFCQHTFVWKHFEKSKEAGIGYNIKMTQHHSDAYTTDQPSKEHEDYQDAPSKDNNIFP